MCFCFFPALFNSRYLGPRVMQKYEIREENIKVFASNIFRIDISGFRIDISGFRIKLSGFRIGISGFRIDISGFRIDVSGFRIELSGFRIDISGFRIEISGYLESFLHFELQVVRIGKEGTEAVEVEFILTLFFSK